MTNKEPLMAGNDAKLTEKDLNKWMEVTNCYPEEINATKKLKEMTEDELKKHNDAVKHAREQPPKALVQLQEWGGE